MCYQTSLVAGAEELARRYGRNADRIRDFRPSCRISAFAHLPYPVVTADDQIRYMRWGLIPYWIRKADQIVTIRNQTVNAPAEGVFEHAAFRVPIRRKRCLVPVSGFYGWRHERAGKVPYYVTVKERSVVSLAGIFDCWIDRATEAAVMTYSIITTEANPMMRYINNRDYRMPVILAPQDEARWLDPELSERQIADMLKPCPEEALCGRPVRCDFLHLIPDDPAILVPA